MYEPHYEEESGGGGFLIGLLCGTALGAAIGLMFAPKAGSEFRQRLYDSTGDIRRKAYETYDQASEQVNNMVAKGRQAVDRGREAFDSRAAVGDRSGTAATARTSDFGNQSRPGVSDFNTGYAHDRRRLTRTVLQARGPGEQGGALLLLGSLPSALCAQPVHEPSLCQLAVRHSPCILAWRLRESMHTIVLIQYIV